MAANEAQRRARGARGGGRWLAACCLAAWCCGAAAAPGPARSAVYAARFARHYLPVALVAVPLRAPPLPRQPVYAAAMPHARWAQPRRVPPQEVLLAREDARGGFRYRRPRPRPPEPEPLLIRVHRHRVVRDR